MDTATLVTIVTSAAVGALVSSVLSLIGPLLERRARRRELLLSKAIELAFARREFVTKAGDRAGVKVDLRDDAAQAAEYFQVLEQIMDRGKLPEFFLNREAKSRREVK